MSINELTLEEVAQLEHTFLGPTWERDENGDWLLPERTLGWQVAAWASSYLNSVSIDSDPADPDPFEFTMEQLRFVLWWYAVDGLGRFVYRRGVLQRLKGWGKDPLLAVISLVEFVGPSQFSHFDDNGQPVGMPHPQAWVQVAAVSKTQTKNTMTLLPTLMSKRLIADHGITVGAELIRANFGRCRLEAVTSNYRTLEGGRSTFVVANETHHWTASNGGGAMWETIDGNTTKGSGGRARYLAITNAYIPGEQSVAEAMRERYEDYLDGKVEGSTTLYDSIEAHEKTPLTREALEVVIPVIRGDAYWLDVESIITSILQSGMTPERSRRMWLNQIVAASDALHTPNDLTEIEVDADLEPGDEIVLGLDGGKTDDSTALVAIRVKDSTAFLLGIWERPDGRMGDEWILDYDDLDRVVAEAHENYSVAGFYSDTYPLESWISQWEFRYGATYRIRSPKGRGAISWDMRTSLKESTHAHMRLMSAIRDKTIKYDGNRFLRAHVLNAVRSNNVHGVYFTKQGRESRRKIDAYAALLLAHEALTDLRTAGGRRHTSTERRSGKVSFL